MADYQSICLYITEYIIAQDIPQHNKAEQSIKYNVMSIGNDFNEFLSNIEGIQTRTANTIV